MSHSNPVSQGDEPTTSLPEAVDPRKNPSYPQRVHAYERPQWVALLKQWDDKIAGARRKLDVLGASPQRAVYDRIYAQMLGGRDQIADAVRRLPGEVGDLYEEDKHRLEEAVAALQRLFVRWESPGGSR